MTRARVFYEVYRAHYDAIAEVLPDVSNDGPYAPGTWAGVSDRNRLALMLTLDALDGLL